MSSTPKLPVILMLTSLTILILSRGCHSWATTTRISSWTRIGSQYADPPTVLSSTPPRPPRRKLPKRRRKRSDERETVVDQDDALWETAEVRPLVPFKSKELGEDYWMDETALKEEEERRKRERYVPQAGQVSDEKLWSEILSPYRQNWIGIFSVIVVILATIVSKFPELLNNPEIDIPDL